MTGILNRIASINVKLQALSRKIEHLENENTRLQKELDFKNESSNSDDFKYKNEEKAVEGIEEIRNSIKRFESEIEACIDIIEEVL